MARHPPKDVNHVAFSRRLQAGDESVLDDIAREYGIPVRCYLRGRYSILTNEDAEELIADTVFAIWTHRTDYDEDKGSLRTWFGIIAVNKALDLLRQRRKPLVRPESNEVLAGQRDTWYWPLSTLSASEHEARPSKRQRLLAALPALVASLPIAQKAVIEAWATAPDESEDREIAAELGLAARGFSPFSAVGA